MTVLPRRFELYRHVDVSGVSGTGVVAYGCLYPNGMATLCWISPHPAVSIWQSLADMLAIHGHEGDTELLWLDDVPARFAEANIGVSLAGRTARGQGVQEVTPLTRR